MNARPPELVCCAYDGSVNSHWVARYAIHLAGASAQRALRVVHVEDGALSRSLFARKLGHVLDDCRIAGIDVSVHSVRATRPVAEAVLASVPAGDATVLLCGTRASPRRASFLAGTVSESLLRHATCNVLALRVVKPGLLGNARRLLLPVAGHPGEGRGLAHFVSLLAPGAHEVHLLRVMLAGDRAARHAPLATLARLRAHGRAAVSYVEQELRSAVDLQAVHVDAYVRVAESWVRPVIITAGQYRCDLVLVGGSPHNLVPGGEIETLLAHAPSDVGIWRAAS